MTSKSLGSFVHLGGIFFQISKIFLIPKFGCSFPAQDPFSEINFLKV